MRIRSLAPLLLLALASCGGPAYRNADLSPERRAKDLVARMSLEEKAGQLLCPLGWPMYVKDGDSISVSEDFEAFIGNQHGGALWATFRADPWTGKTLENGLNPTLAARTYNTLQKYAIEHSRWGIPVLFAEEAPHGHMAIGATVYPTSIGLASTWDPALVREVGSAIGEELRAQGGSVGYGPVIDLAREPRWSRVEETYGEDVYLTSRIASGMVAGTGCSTLKHFIAYGIPEGGHNGNQSIVGERDLLENFLPSFKACIDSGAVSVMTSYNSIDGVPSTANGRLLTGLLRDEWGFDGFVVSDLVSIDGLYQTHRIASGPEDSGALALKAGVDMDLGANCFALLKEAVQNGLVSEKDVDRACRRVLEYKFRIGLFDNPYVSVEDAASRVRTPAHVSTARKAAQESIVLLKNDGILPLREGVRIAVIGPNADNVYNQLGDYTAPQDEGNVITVLKGLENRGCNIVPMAAADVVVAVVGGSSNRYTGTRYSQTGAALVGGFETESGEGFDRSSLILWGSQQELLDKAKASGKPIVAVYIEGRPLDKNWAAENAAALLTAWYPGQEGGNAVADVLFGDYNPAGRLPISVPRSVGQIPVYYNKRIPAGHDYVEMPAAPLYSFGFGLSYTEFEYSGLTLDWPVVSFTVTNTGGRDGEEVAQLYVTDLQASTVRPPKQLRAFRRFFLKQGESTTVSFTLSDEDLAMYDNDMRKVVEPGEFLIAVGGSSDNLPLEAKYTR